VALEEAAMQSMWPATLRESEFEAEVPSMREAMARDFEAETEHFRIAAAL
jgi:hypothetical protein